MKKDRMSDAGDRMLDFFNGTTKFDGKPFRPKIDLVFALLIAALSVIMLVSGAPGSDVPSLVANVLILVASLYSALAAFFSMRGVGCEKGEDEGTWVLTVPAENESAIRKVAAFAVPLIAVLFAAALLLAAALAFRLVIGCILPLL